MVLAVCLEVSAAQAVSAVPAVPATRGMDVMTIDVMTSSGKHWTLLIGEDQTNSSSKKLKRGVTKRIGSMADMRSFEIHQVVPSVSGSVWSICQTKKRLIC